MASEGRVLEVHVHDEEVADAFKRMLEQHPDVSMWAYDEYRECDGCGENKRIVQGGCCCGCMELALADVPGGVV